MPHMTSGNRDFYGDSDVYILPKTLHQAKTAHLNWVMTGKGSTVSGYTTLFHKNYGY